MLRGKGDKSGNVPSSEALYEEALRASTTPAKMYFFDLIFNNKDRATLEKIKMDVRFTEEERNIVQSLIMNLH
jgi:hypothetical protein